MMSKDTDAFEYYEGFFSFRNAYLEVLMDEVTFERYVQAYLLRQGQYPRSAEDALDTAIQARWQRVEAERVLMNPQYWRGIVDPHVRLVPRTPGLAKPWAPEAPGDEGCTAGRSHSVGDTRRGDAPCADPGVQETANSSEQRSREERKWMEERKEEEPDAPDVRTPREPLHH